MEKYQITIKNLETEAVLVDVSTAAIIAGIDEGDGTRSVCLTACNSIELVGTVVGAMRAANRGLEDLPARLARQARKLGNKNKKK